MLRFRLGSIPVEVHPTHLLVSALLGWMTVRGLSSSTSNEWPYRQLQDPGGPGYAQTALLVVLAWMFIIFLSVLVHELGHALAGRMFGYRPSIELVWLGGLTRTNAPSTIPWHRMVVVTAAGPLAGLLLGLTALGILKFADLRSPIPNTILLWFFLANLFWTLFNLLPVPPLDGGHIVSTVATRFLGRAGFIGAQGVALVVCIALVAYSVKRKDPFICLFFGLYGLQAMRLLMAAWRGELKVDADEQPELLVKGLQLARSELAEGRLETARLRGQALLESEELTPELASRTHHLLGWVALKDGQGRAALDHFSQVQREPVETHALAAAFSLVGDENRALTLWELAWKETHNPTVMHEYAGSLIRADRVRDALKLPEVNLESAFDCAQRTLFIRGAYSEAARIAEEGLGHVPSARLAYDAACAHARARHRDNALRLLHRATELGFQDATYAASDEDLASLHGQPDFEQWLSALRKSASA